MNEIIHGIDDYLVDSLASIVSWHRLLLIFVVSMLMGVSLPAFAAWQTPALPTQVLAEQQAAPAPGITATVREPFYKISVTDVGDAVAEQLRVQAVETKSEVMLAPGTPRVLFQSDHAVKTVIHALQIDPKAKRWQAEAHFVSGNKTESVVPVSGTYGALVDVPVLTRQFNRTDVIAEQDITTLAVAERLLNKDTVTDAKALIGLSPRVGISSKRPIRSSEIAAPAVIKRGDVLEMSFNTPYIHIKTTGLALEDGAKGQTIRVKNQKSERAVSARVVDAGRVEVSNTAL